MLLSFSGMNGIVKFYTLDVSVNLRAKKLLKNFIKNIFIQEASRLGQVKFIFCTDNYLKRLNSRYLNHHRFTDVITFNLSPNKMIDGEVFISLERVRINSTFYKTSFRDELLRVIFHGVLHLCGYSDKTLIQKRKMSHQEDLYLNNYRSVSSS